MKKGTIEYASACEAIISCYCCGYPEILPINSHYYQELTKTGRHLCLNCNTFQAVAEARENFAFFRVMAEQAGNLGTGQLLIS